MKRAWLLLLLVAGCSQDETPPAPQADTITPKLETLAARAEPGTLAALMVDLDTAKARGVNVDTPMPMQSVFKLPLAIVVMDAVDKGKLKLDQKLTLTKEQLSLAHSPIADAFPGRADYTLEQLVAAAVQQSDNTAADVLTKMVGGPREVTRFFRAKGVETFRLDRYEYELQPQAVGLPAFTGQWIGSKAFNAAQETVPLQSQQAALRIYLADPRDRVSPRGAVEILGMLAKGHLLTPASTQKMMDILKGTTTGRDRIPAGAPKGATVYHKTGTGPDVGGVNSATNDIGIVELPGGKRIAVAVFLSGTELDAKQRAATIAEVTRLATTELVPAPLVP